MEEYFIVMCDDHDIKTYRFNSDEELFIFLKQNKDKKIVIFKGEWNTKIEYKIGGKDISILRINRMNY